MNQSAIQELLEKMELSCGVKMPRDEHKQLELCKIVHSWTINKGITTDKLAKALDAYAMNMFSIGRNINSISLRVIAEIYRNYQQFNKSKQKQPEVYEYNDTYTAEEIEWVNHGRWIRGDFIPGVKHLYEDFMKNPHMDLLGFSWIADRLNLDWKLYLDKASQDHLRELNSQPMALTFRDQIRAIQDRKNGTASIRIAKEEAVRQWMTENALNHVSELTINPKYYERKTD